MASSSYGLTTAPSSHHYHDHKGAGLSGIVVGTAVLAAWIIFSNLVLIIALVTSDRRRQISFHLHTVNLSIASLVIGVLILPLYAEFESKGRWEHSDTTCRLWLVSDLLVCTVSVLVVGMMVFDRFVLYSCSSVKHGKCKFIFSALVFLAPWGLAASFVIPVYLRGQLGEGVDAANGLCYVDMNGTYSIMYILGGFFVPAVAAFGILVAMTMSWIVHRAALRQMHWSVEVEATGWQVLVSWLQCVTVLGMWLPVNILYLLLYVVDNRWPSDWLVPALGIAYANAAVTPLVWLLMPSVLKSVVKLFRCCCCCCCRNQDREPSETKKIRRTHPVTAEHSHRDDASVAMLDFKYKSKE